MGLSFPCQLGEVFFRLDFRLRVQTPKLNQLRQHLINVKHYHLVIHKHMDGKVTLLLSKPYLKRVDISKYVVAEL